MPSYKPSNITFPSALAGSSSEPAHGSPLSVGYAFYDDFISDSYWNSYNLNTSSLDTSKKSLISSNAITEAGIIRVTTGSLSSGEGGIITVGEPTINQYYLNIITSGFIYTCKLKRNSASINNIAYSGMITNPLNHPSAAGLPSFIGFRASLGNWYAIVKTGGGSETSVDLGLSSTVWNHLCFEFNGTNIIFSTFIADLNRKLYKKVLAIIDNTHFYTGGYNIVAGTYNIGLVTTTIRTLDVDYINVGGRAER